ncbi:MAG: exo-alpha-sialidase, partial [Chlorobi bacterium]|nr:exo-alpha-sialidase [Chlorobiota bacterium]
MTTNKITNIFLVFIIAALTTILLYNSDIDNYKEFPSQRFSIDTKDNPIARAEFELRMVRNPKTGKVPNEIRRKEIKFVKDIPSRKINTLSKTGKIETLDFQSRGPVNRGGRTRALGVDIRSTSGNVTIIAAGVSGGIWKSTNDGAAWTQTSLPSQINNATCIVQDTRTGHEDTWYIGTGEARGNSASGGNAFYLGDGIFKSIDNGQSWSRIPSTVRNTPQTYNFPFNLVHALAINPATGTLFAAASNVIMRSANGGDSWTTVRGSLANSTPTFVTASTNGYIYAAVNSSVADKGIWKSTNDGASWSNITPAGFPQVYNRVIIAVAPSDPNRIYLLAHTPGSGADSPAGVGDEHSFWVSMDGGNSWTERTNNLPNADNVAGYSSQGGYDMVMAVKPNDPNYVVVGGTNLFRSTDAFATKITNTKTNWIGGYALANDISQYTNHHADQHALVFAPFNSRIIYSGNDGGVQVCRDLSQPTVVWNQLNNGYQTSQFYSIALDHASSGDNTLLGGLQDNAHYFTNSSDPSSAWKEMIAGGDGGFTAIADNKTSYYIEPQNGLLIRLRLNEAGNWQNWTVAKPSHNTNYLFINPYVLDPNNTNRMYFVAGDSLWRNNDLT